METHPDSSLSLLKNIDKNSLHSKADKARYALLMSMALDKNYIDTTTFDVLQPAIDYYLKKGTPDQKLRTYYYQGIIFMNQKDRDKTMNALINALDIAPESTDTLIWARALVAEACTYFELYDFNNYILNSLKAAELYKGKNRKELEFDCLMEALNGSLGNKDQSLSDSLFNIIHNEFNPLTDKQKRRINDNKLRYTVQFGDKHEVEDFLANYNIKDIYDMNGILNLASAYRKVGNPKKALELLDYAEGQGIPYDTLKLESTAVYAYKELKDFEKAFSTYWDFSKRLETINRLKFNQKVQSIDEKHWVELKAQKDAQKKSKIIWGCIGGIIILILIILSLYIWARGNKIKRELAQEKVKSKEAENATLKSESEKLALENLNLQLERDKKALEAENLSHKVEQLEEESESLRHLMEEKKDLPEEVRKTLQTRMEMLNALLAGYITDNQQLEKPYEIWVKDLTDNTKDFMNSNRLAFQASHPNFIKYFEDHGLTESEINYVCLYAIGLKGKEVGNYMKKPSHVNTSSAIRKKLGIDKYNTNIGIYVRNLLKDL